MVKGSECWRQSQQRIPGEGGPIERRRMYAAACTSMDLLHADGFRVGLVEDPEESLDRTFQPRPAHKPTMDLGCDDGSFLLAVANPCRAMGGSSSYMVPSRRVG